MEEDINKKIEEIKQKDYLHLDEVINRYIEELSISLRAYLELYLMPDKEILYSIKELYEIKLLIHKLGSRNIQGRNLANEIIREVKEKGITGPIN